MNQETREQIALARYRLISPVLAEPGRVQSGYLRSQAAREHQLPHYGWRRLGVSTLKLWPRRYRERLFSGLAANLTLGELNEAFALWLREDYHYKVHAGIGRRPSDPCQASASRLSIQRLSKTELDAIFLVRHDRIVGNDATISFKGRIYEVPGAYIRQRIEIRHPVDDATALTLYDNGARVLAL
jgi:hypothetical protein